MSAGEKIAVAIRENPVMAIWAIYVIWGVLFGTAVIGLMTMVYFVFGPETTGYFLIGLIASGFLFAGVYLLLGRILSPAISMLARIFFP